MADRRTMKTISAAGFVLSALLCLYAWRTGLFASQERMQEWIAGFGGAGAAVFIAFQAVQVVFPIVPGGLGCLAGVLMFGPMKGFIYNYLGICAGSMLAFLASRFYGRDLLRVLFSEKLMKKYGDWTSENDRFEKLFAAAIFLPVAPDDFLCYLAGTTNMSLGRFTAIILLGKPGAIALYSLGLHFVFTGVTG